MKLLIASLIFTISLSSWALNCRKYKSDIKQIMKVKKNQKKFSCKGNNVHLTFDDGPSAKFTPKILDTLKRQKVKATFFISTHQLEKNPFGKKKKILKRMLKEGYTVASHGHDHNAHDLRYVNGKLNSKGYNDRQRAEQISKSIKLLDKFTDQKFSKQKHKLIRFPYGRGIMTNPFEIEKMRKQGRRIAGSSDREKLRSYQRNSPAMRVASSYGLSHMGWSHDSKDASAKGVPAKKNSYVQQALRSLCKGGKKNKIALFHDVRAVNSTKSKYHTKKHPMTVMDEIIEKARCMKINFLTLDQMLRQKLTLSEYTPRYSTKAQVKEIAKYLDKPARIEPIAAINNFFKLCKTKVAPAPAESVTSIKGQSCRIGQKSTVNIPGFVSCYCQYKNGRTNPIWKCYDIASPGKPQLMK